MSALQRQMLRPRLPPSSGPSRSVGAKGSIKRRDYTPVKWNKYFETHEDVKINENDVFRVYRSGHSGPLLLFLHGGGFSGLTWATLTASIMELVECQVAAIDLRGHGETRTDDEFDLSAETLANDVGNVVNKLFGDGLAPKIILVGHSMGGAVAVHVAHRDLIPTLIGLAVIDVVEGTAMDALQSMQSFLRSRPVSFKSMESAIEWCVRSGQVRNSESARVSMPGQIKNVFTNKPGTIDLEDDANPLYEATTSQIPGPLEVERSNNSIPEEQEEMNIEPEEKKDEEKETNSPTKPSVDLVTEQGDGSNEAVAKDLKKLSDDNFLHPSKMTEANRYTWRIDLSQTEKFWPGWFHGLSTMFLSCSAPKMLLLAGIDRLDKELTIGQMQGKFQMQVLPQCGHAVHEDVPDKVAEVLATFMVRHRFVQPTATFQPTFPAC